MVTLPVIPSCLAVFMILSFLEVFICVILPLLAGSMILFSLEVFMRGMDLMAREITEIATDTTAMIMTEKMMISSMNKLPPGACRWYRMIDTS